MLDVLSLLGEPDRAQEIFEAFLLDFEFLSWRLASLLGYLD